VFVLTSENANDTERKAESERDIERKSMHEWIAQSVCVNGNVRKCKREREIDRIYEINLYKIDVRNQDRYS